MTTQMLLILAIFVLMIVGYVFGGKVGISNGVCAMAAIAAIGLTGVVPAKEIVTNFMTKTTLQIIGMFVIAAGFRRTQAVKKMSALVYKISSGNWRVALAGYAFMGFILANFGLSPMTTFAIIGPLAAECCAEFNISPSKIMFPLMIVCISTFHVLPIGSGAPLYATQHGYLESYEYTEHMMEMLDLMKGRLPIAILIILYAIFIAPKLCPDKDVSLTSSVIKTSPKKGVKEEAPLNPFREAVGYICLIVTTFCLIFQKTVLPNAEAWQIAFFGATVVMVTGVLTPKEGINAIPMRIVMMLAAANTVGSALTATGLGDAIGNAMANVLGGTTNGYIIGAAFFVVPFILTQFMNNQSVSYIFLPILILTCKALGCNPVGPMILLQSACLSAYMTPMATGTVPIGMDLGGYDQGDLFKMGWLPALIMCVTSVLYVMTIFPAY